MKYSARTAPPPGGDAMEFVLSDASVDRVGDVIEQNWDLSEFEKNPIALFNHDRNQIVGGWKDVRVAGKRLVGKLQLAAEGTSEIADTVRKLVAQGFLRATSVGFQPIKKEKLTPDASEFWGPFRFLKSQLLEASLVSVPANPNAVALARSLNLKPELVGAIFSKPANETRAVSPASPPNVVDTKRVKQMNISSTLASRIDAAQKNVLALRDNLIEITSKDDQDEEESRRAVELPDEIETAENALQTLLRQERAITGGRREGNTVTQSTGSTTVEVVKQKPQEIVRPGELSSAERERGERRPFGSNAGPKLINGDYVFRSLVTWFAAHASRETIDHVLRTRYGDQDRDMNMVLRAAVNPATTTVAGWAAELVQTQNAGFLDRILPKSIYLPLANRGNRYTFGPGITQLKIPVRTTTALLSGAWVGEGSPKPVKKASFSSVPLTPFKLAVISTFTEEMALYSNPAIEAIIRQALQDDTSVSLDTFLIDAVALSSSRPAGLLNGVSPLTATASGTTTEKMVADLKQLIAAIIAAGGGTDIVVIINPAQAITLGFAQTTTGDFLFANVQEAGQKFNISFIVSQTVAAGRVIAIEASEFATATGDTPRFAISNEATLHEEDTTPLAIGTAGAPATVAAPARSLFQTDSVALRLTLYVTWAMRRASMVQTIAAVGW
jgi:HK97 family phage prohead protease/HK97 family phage major capsid protein